MNKIYIDGSDDIGWSIDCDRNHIKQSVTALGFEVTDKWYEADIIHNIWWNSILKYNYLKLLFKRNVLVTTSNFIDFSLDGFHLKDEFYKVNRIAKGWIVPSLKQKKILESYGVKNVYYQPFYIDLDLFKPSTIAKEKLCSNFDIPYDVIKGRCVIGSFQRDSLGSDLTKGKWQKAPEFLIELLKDLPKDEFVLLLAGPRRHYVIAECKKHDIPYYFIGNETNSDDLESNAVPIKNMPDLYALSDVYLITSKSEGGPKAAMEATATKTFIMSTDVGLSGDFIHESCVFRDRAHFKNELAHYIKKQKNCSYKIKNIIEENYKRAISILNTEAMNQRLKDIYKAIL